MSGLLDCLAVALGGAMGCSCRWGVSQLPFYTGKDAFWATLTVNVAGCLLIGVAAALFSHFSRVDALWYRLAVTGFLGGFTTYSSFSLETMQLVHGGRWQELTVYVGLTLVLGLAACAVGLSGMQKLLCRI